MDSKFNLTDEPEVLCTYYNTFSTEIDLNEKYKFISASELHSIMKHGARSFSQKNGWVIDLFSEASNFSFDVPRKALNFVETYALEQSSETAAAAAGDAAGVGSSEWVFFKTAKVAELMNTSPSSQNSRTRSLSGGAAGSSSAAVAKKAVAEIAKLMTSVQTLVEPNADVILTHICQALLNPEGLTVPFFENVMNAFVQKHVLLSAETYSCIPTQSVDMGLHTVLKTMKVHNIVGDDTVVGILTPCTSSVLETIAGPQYDFKVNCIAVENNGLILESEFEKLRNPELTVLIVANMSSILLSQITIDKISRLIAESRSDLVIIQDASLYPFCNKMARFKNNNTITLFSFRKLFGSACPHALIALPTNNVLDTLYVPIFYQDDVGKAHVYKRYAPADPKVAQLNFARKMLFDSVNISGRENTCIVSLRDQLLMCFYAVIDYSKFLNKSSKILSDRVALIQSYLGIIDLPQTEFAKDANSPDAASSRCNYYMNINLIDTANALLGKDDFGDYIFKNFNAYELYMLLAENNGLIIMPGSAMNRSAWDIRVNVTCLTDEECGYVGNTLKHQILMIYEKYQEYLKKLDTIKFGLK